MLMRYGDVPTIRTGTFAAVHEAQRKSRAAVSFISVRVANPSAYGRVVRDEAGKVRAIVEARDATVQEQAIDEINTGFYCADAAFLRSALGELKPDNQQGEYYLTDIIGIARGRGLEVNAWIASDPAEIARINSA